MEKRFTVRRDEKGAILIPNSILKDGEIIDEKETVDLLNEQQATIKQQDIEIKNLNLHIGKLVDGSEISQQLMKEYERNDKLEAKIESMVEQHKARLDKLIEKVGEQQATIEELKEENEQLKKENSAMKEEQEEMIAHLKKQNEQLRKELYECEKDYLIETSDISDKIYLEDEIKKLKKEYGVIDDEL